MERTAPGLPAFPAGLDEDAFERWRVDPARWTLLVRAIAAHENIPADGLAPFATGTNLVVDLGGGVVLKLFPPLYRGQFVSERATLRLLYGRLSVPIPGILAEGEHDGWSYLILTRLDGVLGSEVWPSLHEAEKEGLLEEIGRTIAEVQAVPLGALAAIEPSWPDFIARQAASCVTRHRALGLAPRLLAGLAPIVAAVPAVVPVDAPPVILTGEWIPENLLLSRRDGRWRLAAIIDFGDVMTGLGEYDLLGPSVFMGGGLAGRMTSLLRGYGLRPAATDPAMRRRLLTLMLLHRASDLRKVASPGWQRRVATLADLEDIIWPA